MGFSAMPSNGLDFSRITAITITHRTASLDAIGRLEGLVSVLYSRLYPFVDGVVVLHTCNRFEAYIDADPAELGRVLEEAKSILGEYWEKALVLRGVDAVRHLYRVACGLDSVMLGENEILGQVRKAWMYARENAYTSRLLDMIFHGAIVAGRKARRETGISRGAIGYPEAAVEIASRRQRLERARILVIGAGKAGRIIVETLCSKYKPRELIIANRSLGKAVRLAGDAENRYGCKALAIGLDGLKEVESIDVVFIAVSGSPKIRGLEEKSKLIVDISTPPVVGKTEKTILIDEVSSLVRENIEKRRKEIPRVEEIIESEIARLVRLVREKRAETTISTIMRAARRLAIQEALETRKALRGLSEVDGVMDRAFWSYAKKLLHPLLVSLRQLALDGDEKVLRILEEKYGRLLSSETSSGFRSDHD